MKQDLNKLCIIYDARMLVRPGDFPWLLSLKIKGEKNKKNFLAVQFPTYHESQYI